MNYDTKKMVPLTLEQLREMDGKPVFVDSVKRWGIVDMMEKVVAIPGYCVIPLGAIGNKGAYAYQPAHIDREAWEPCGACKDGKITIHVPEFRAMAICNQHMDHEAFDLTLSLRFCPWCGRPLTEEAWAELEKRLRG